MGVYLTSVKIQYKPKSVPTKFLPNHLLPLPVNSKRNTMNTPNVHPRIECGICGMHISEKHLSRHRFRRHPSCPNNKQMIKQSEVSSQSPEPNGTKAKLHAPNESNIINADVQQSIAEQSKKSFSDTVRYVKVRISEQDLIKFMKCGRIYHAVGKFFMYNSQNNEN